MATPLPLSTTAEQRVVLVVVSVNATVPVGVEDAETVAVNVVTLFDPDVKVGLRPLLSEVLVETSLTETVRIRSQLLKDTES